jgi:PAS domain S-box-containing protein
VFRPGENKPYQVYTTFEDITERQQAEAALRESEERFRLAINATEDGLWEWDIQTNQEFFSPRWCEIIGYSCDDPELPHTYESWASRVHPDDYDRVASAITNHLEKGTRYDVDYRHRHKSGEYRWQNSKGQAVLDESGKPLKMVGRISDITERKQAEEALRESEERFRSLSASAPIGIFLTDAQGNAVYANEHLQSLGGAPFEENTGHAWINFIHPDDREAVFAEAYRAAAEQCEFSQEFRLLTKAGEERWVHSTGAAILSPEGVVTGHVGTIEDITERKRAEEAMANRLKMESAIARASNLLAGPEDVDAALNLALRILGEAFGADRAHIFLFRDNNTRMDNTSEWCAPGIAPQIDNLQDLDSTAFPWWIDRLSQNEPIIMTDTSAAPPEAALEKKSWKGLNIHSLLAVPLLSDGKPIGYVRFANMKSDSTEREEDIRLLRLASESIASFIERQRAGEDKRNAYESIVFLLATAAEARDPYTEDHLYRIRGFAEAIAAELGLPPDEIREIGFSSLLHDLGKIRVPDSILTKPGPLSAAEWKIMKQHPLWGEELLSAHPWLETARQIARWHHERWDGTGYPDGLHAEQIPLGAAIVTVADSLDAMISDRPYKGPWPQQQAIVEIRAQKGRQYSPDVVEAFNRALRKGEIKRVTDATLRLSKPARAA